MGVAKWAATTARVKTPERGMRMAARRGFMRPARQRPAAAML